MDPVVPALARQRALASGAAGHRWLKDLPGVVAALAAQWDLELGEPFAGGTASFACAATMSDGREAVLKVAMRLSEDDDAAFRRSVVTHRLAGGRGCAGLLAVDPGAGALLLERLGPNLHDLELPLDEVLEAIAATLLVFWQPVGPEVDLPTGADKARWLAAFIETTWVELGRPCEREVVRRALDCCESRAAAFDPASAVLVHGDAHGWNTLVSRTGGHAFVDPEGLRSDRANDLAVPMREYNAPLLAGPTSVLVRERAQWLAERCGADAEAVWEWGFVERVSTGLAGLREFEGDESLAFLEVARRSR